MLLAGFGSLRTVEKAQNGLSAGPPRGTILGMTRTRFHIAGLSRLLASAPQPVYALDADHTITFANAACEAWTGLAADSLLGRRCDYQSGYRSDGTPDPVHGLCPPPEAFWVGT